MTRQFIALLVFASVAAAPCVAGAQNPQPASPGVQASVAPPNFASPPPEKVAPGGLDSQASNQSLSDRLALRHGMLQPHAVDPGMTVTPPPQTGGTMPVIPPPGSPGGDQNVVPK